MLVTGRSFGDADDVASILHNRVDRYVTEVGYPSPPAHELVAGLFPRPSAITDPDVLLALDERANAIEQRARTLADEAIERGDPWVSEFGVAPTTCESYENWVQDVAAGAAYVDRWDIDTLDTIIDDLTVSHEQNSQRRRAISAAQRARTLNIADNMSQKSTNVQLDEEPRDSPIMQFEFDL